VFEATKKDFERTAKNCTGSVLRVMRITGLFMKSTLNIGKV